MRRQQGSILKQKKLRKKERITEKQKKMMVENSTGFEVEKSRVSRGEESVSGGKKSNLGRFFGKYRGGGGGGPKKGGEKQPVSFRKFF